MPDETILAPRCIGHPAAEKLVLAANQWMSAGMLRRPGGSSVRGDRAGHNAS